MKILICSDIHGDYESIRTVMNFFEEKECDKLLILGDILYHGPRNDLPPAYAPKAVIKLLNSYKDKIIAVRGNCEAEVDQMVLEFSVMADYVMLNVDGVNIFATHGHKYNMQTPPPLAKGDILLHGHTHVLANVEFGNSNLYLNPGSVSIPKENNPKTFLIFENGIFTIYDLEGNILMIQNA